VKRKKRKLTAEFWERNAQTMRLLEERVAYHTRKLEEERAARREPQT
jgi:hypothetical protein